MSRARSATRHSGWKHKIVAVSTIGLFGCAGGEVDRSPNLQDPVINQYFYTPISSIPADWVGDILLLSPLQQSLAAYPWYALYLPTRFDQTGPLGSWEDLKLLAKQASSQGRAVGCDLVLQHTAAAEGGTDPIAAPPFSPSEQGPLGPFGWNINYGQQSARAKARGLVEGYVARGARLLRYDAAHLIPPKQLAEILLPQEFRPQVMQVLELAGGRETMMQYLMQLGRSDVRTYDFQWSVAVNEAVNGRLENLSRSYPLPFGQTVLPISTHDFFVMGGTGSGRNIDFSLLRFFGLTAFSLPTQLLTTDLSLPNNLTQIGIHGQHRLHEIHEILDLRAQIKNQPLFWLRTSNPDVAVAYQRGDSHLFALSKNAQSQNITVEHDLRPGSYRELFSGRVYEIGQNPIVLAQQTENRYALVRIHEAASAPFEGLFKVPPVLHTIWCQGVAQAPNGGAVESFQQIGLTIQQWDCERFERELLPKLSNRQAQAYERIKEWKVTEPRHRWMMLSDLMRLAILAHHGGYYADLDSVCHWPFQSHFQDYEFVVSLQGDGRINNAFIAASTKSRPVQNLLLEATDRILAHSTEEAPPVCWPAGPDLYTEKVRDQLGTLVLPAQIYISYQPGVVNPSCYVSHFYASVCGDYLPSNGCAARLYAYGSYPAYQTGYGEGGGKGKSANFEEAYGYGGLYSYPRRLYPPRQGYPSYSADPYGADSHAAVRVWEPHAGRPAVPAPQRGWVWIDSVR
jgi:hypothetical protein